MPIIWRYITKTYLKIFALSLFTLFGLSFLINHKKLTLLIVAGATYKQALLLILCMLSITLPYALGLCSFLSSFITIYRLNSSGELTSLRASGLSLSKIFAPLYFASGILMLINLILISEIVPHSKLLMTQLYFDSQSINPLVLLRKKALPFLKNIYIEMDLNSTASESNNVLIAHFLENEKRIALLLADHFDYSEKFLRGKKVTFISYLSSELDQFDHLIIDNQKELSSPESFFLSLMHRPSRLNHYDAFNLQALLKTKKSSGKAELFQRVSKMFYPLTFTILGLSMGLFNRRRSFFLSLLIFGYFASFFALKNIHFPFFVMLFLSLVPHFFITLFSFLHQKKFLQGRT